MSTGTGIQWTSATWNPVTGCTHCSAGCDRCYAVKQTYRLEMMGQVAKYGGLTVLNPKGDRHFNGVVRCHDDALPIPLKWRKPQRIFVNSMSDLFHKDVPFEFVDKVFAVMALCPQHTFQVLTKRPERMAEYTSRTGKSIEFLDGAARAMGRTLRFEIDGKQIGLCPWPLPGVWLGTSCENQEWADKRIPHLLQCPAAIRFISAEPLIGPIDYLASWLVGCSDAHLRPRQEADQLAKRDRHLRSIHWVIVGGESGPSARPMNVKWARSIVQQCKSAGVACFVKQMGARIELPNDRTKEWGRDGDVLSFESDATSYQGEEEIARLEDAKGGDPSEWPTDLRVREFPELRGTPCKS